MNNIIKSLYIINIGAKDCFFVAEVLESYLEKGWFPDFYTDEEKTISNYSEAAGVSVWFNDDFIYYSCLSETECFDCMISDVYRGCPYFKELSAPSMVISKKEYIKEGIKKLRDKGEYLYRIKEACIFKLDAIPKEYVAIEGKYYKIMTLPGYHPHLPVDDREEALIKKGLISVRTEKKKRGKRKHMPYSVLLDSARILEDFLNSDNESAHEENINDKNI